MCISEGCADIEGAGVRDYPRCTRENYIVFIIYTVADLYLLCNRDINGLCYEVN